MNYNHENLECITYTIGDITKLLGIGRDAAYKLTYSKGFPCLKNGNRCLIPKKAFHIWLENQVN